PHVEELDLRRRPVMAEVPEVPPVSAAQGSPASPPSPSAPKGPSVVDPSPGGAPSPEAPPPQEAIGPRSAADADRIVSAASADLTRSVGNMRQAPSERGYTASESGHPRAVFVLRLKQHREKIAGVLRGTPREATLRQITRENACSAKGCSRRMAASGRLAIFRRWRSAPDPRRFAVDRRRK